MITFPHNERLHTEATDQFAAKLRPGAAVAFTIASVVAVLSFIEIVFS